MQIVVVIVVRKCHWDKSGILFAYVGIAYRTEQEKLGALALSL